MNSSLEEFTAEIIPFPNCSPRVMEGPKPAQFIPPWKGLHPNSKAYANAMAAFLRETCQDEAKAAEWYRSIRCREIPPEPESTHGAKLNLENDRRLS